jgi:hypothetical protein
MTIRPVAKIMYPFFLLVLWLGFISITAAQDEKLVIKGDGYGLSLCRYRID